MSFSKRSDAAPVCYSKPLDSVKYWNDNFFWVDATAFPVSMPLHKSKTLKKDPPPNPLNIMQNRYYDLYENVYPSFLDDNTMDLFSFIHHADPTKVRVGEIERAEGQVPLLEATRGRVVSLAPAVPITAASSKGNLTESIDRLFDEGDDAEKEHSVEEGDDVVLMETAIEHVNKDVVGKPKRLRKRKAIEDAGGSTLPPKKLRDDYGTSSTFVNIGRKSRAAIQSLLDSSKLSVEIGVMAASTMPLVTSSVTPMPEREGGDNTNFVYALNLQTKPLGMRFVISSDSANHSGTHVVDAKVSSLVRSVVSDPPVMIFDVATTVVGDTSKVQVMSVNPVLFGDSMSTSGHNAAGPSSLAHPDLSVDSFYVISLPPALFTQLRTMEYDQLYMKFNVGAARQTCLGAEVWMRAEHMLRKKKIMKDECAQQASRLKERDEQIANLKAQLYLKEVEATEAIRLRDQISNAEAADAARVSELNGLKERNVALEEQVAALESTTTNKDADLANLQVSCNELSVKAFALELEKDKLIDQVSALEITCSGIF
ncbi:hypothetical protein Tco_1222297 [Tanacetum coccineum]